MADESARPTLLRGRVQRPQLGPNASAELVEVLDQPCHVRALAFTEIARRAFAGAEEANEPLPALRLNALALSPSLVLASDRFCQLAGERLLIDDEPARTKSLRANVVR